MSTDSPHDVQALETKLREQKNAAFAGLFLAVLVTALSVAYLLYIEMHDPNEPVPEEHQAVISADSLRHLMYTVEEQAREIEAQAQQIEQLQAQLNDSTRISSQMPEEPATESTEATEVNDAAQSTQIPATKASSSSTSEPVSGAGTYHIVKEGESLWSIAEMHFGDGYKAREIAEINNKTDVALIVVGETLVLGK